MCYIATDNLSGSSLNVHASWTVLHSWWFTCQTVSPFQVKIRNSSYTISSWSITGTHFRILGYIKAVVTHQGCLHMCEQYHNTIFQLLVVCESMRWTIYPDSIYWCSTEQFSLCTRSDTYLSFYPCIQFSSYFHTIKPFLVVKSYMSVNRELDATSFSSYKPKTWLTVDVAPLRVGCQLTAPHIRFLPVG